MTAEPDPREPTLELSGRDVWGDEPHERDASEVHRIISADPQVGRRWRDHALLAPFRAVGLFLARSGKRIAVTIAGAIVLLLGIAGLALPILPGWLLIIAGLGILATEYVWAQRLLRRAREVAAQAASKVRPGRAKR